MTIGRFHASHAGRIPLGGERQAAVLGFALAARAFVVDPMTFFVALQPVEHRQAKGDQLPASAWVSWLSGALNIRARQAARIDPLASARPHASRARTSS